MAGNHLLWVWASTQCCPILARIEHPDDISGVLIRALWEDLNRALTPEEQIRVEAKRKLVSEKESTYLRLAEECTDQLAPSKNAFEACYLAHGLPSKNRLNRDPFLKMIIKKDGSIGEIIFFKGASDELKKCLLPILNSYHFSPFEYDEQLTLIPAQLKCNVSELRELY